MTAIMQDIDACVFDAYGTLFDFAAAAACWAIRRNRSPTCGGRDG